MKKKLLTMMMAAAMVFSLAACGSSSGSGSEGESGSTQTESEELTPVSFRLNYTAAGLHVPYYYALEQGYYEDVGLDVTIGEGTGAGTTARMIGSGEEDLGLVDSGSLASAIQEGIPVKTVCPIYAVNGYGVITLADSGIEKPEDLEGKRIGVTTGDAPYNLFAAFVAANGIDDSTLNYVSMDANAKVTSLINGDVDCILGGADDQAVTLQTMGNDVNVLRYSDYGVPTVGLSIVASEDTIAENPDMIEKFISATMKAWDECRKDPDPAVEVFMDSFGTLDEETVRGSLQVALDSLFAEDSETLGDVSEADWEECRDLLVEYLGISEDVQATDLYTFDCLPDDLPAR